MMIKWIKRLVVLVVFGLALVLGITFTAENSTLIGITLFGYHLPQLQLGVWIMVVLLLGAFIGLLLSFLPLLWGRQSMAAKNRKIHQLQQELNQLRNTGLKG